MMMKKFIFLLILTLPLQLNAQLCEIYSRSDSTLWGWAEDRSRIERFTRSDFLNAPFAESESLEGYLTAVTLSREASCVLKELSAWKSPVTWCELTLEMIDAADNRYGVTLYEISSGQDHLSYLFALEQPSEEMLAWIDRVYAEEPEVGANVVRRYGDSLVIRMFGGEDFNDNGTFDAREALAGATLLGDKEQWLWGIRDGMDYTSPLRECEPALEQGILPCGEALSAAVPPAAEPANERRSTGKPTGVQLIPGTVGRGGFTPLETPSDP